MKINLSIKALLNLTNNEALLLFATAICNKINPDAIIDDIIRLSSFGYQTTFTKLIKFETEGLIKLEHNKNRIGKHFSYIEPTDRYITVDSSLLLTNVDRNVMGALIRLKCWSRINTNIVDLSLNRVVHEVSIQHNSVYKAIEEGLLKRGKKKLYFEFVHPSLTTPA